VYVGRLQVGDQRGRVVRCVGSELEDEPALVNGTLIALAPAMANTGTCRSFAVVAIACTQSSHGRVMTAVTPEELAKSLTFVIEPPLSDRLSRTSRRTFRAPSVPVALS